MSLGEEIYVVVLECAHICQKNSYGVVFTHGSSTATHFQVIFLQETIFS